MRYIALTLVSLLIACCPVEDLVPLGKEVRLIITKSDTGSSSLIYEGIGSHNPQRASFYTFSSPHNLEISLMLRNATDSCAYAFDWNGTKDTIWLSYRKQIVQRQPCKKLMFDIKFSKIKVYRSTFNSIKQEYLYDQPDSSNLTITTSY